jgi:Cu2+-containing amine oxidase
VTETQRTAVHPLDPLTAEEITAAARIIRAHENFGEGHRFASIAVHFDRSPALDVPPPTTNGNCGHTG